MSIPISTLETHATFFDRQSAAKPGVLYYAVQDYLKNTRADRRTEVIPQFPKKVTAEVAADDVMSKFQIDPHYVPALKTRWSI
jgi:hypothetical protein